MPGLRNTSQYFESFDLLLKATPGNRVKTSSDKKYTTANAIDSGCVVDVLEQLVSNCYKKRSKLTDQCLDAALKVIISPHSGYLCRRDILELRMRHSPLVDCLIPFETPNSYYSSVPGSEKHLLLALLSSSPGALLLKEPTEIDNLQQDLEVRLSFEWMLSNKPTPRKVAIVGGRAMFDAKKKSFCLSGPYEAAQALGISLVVVDKPGHWLEGPAYSHLRDDFISVDMTLDEELVPRIMDALDLKKIDGIVAFADEYVEVVAQVAANMCLPTDPVSAFMQAVDKHATRNLVDLNAGSSFVRMESSTQLNAPSMLTQLECLEYPLIVKPCRGGGSRGVRKVRNWTELRQAVHMVEREGYSKEGILVETYADGPEVDANFTLWDGEILFFEMCDDFPCLADAENATVLDDFNEDIMILPSGLSLEEKQKVKSDLHRVLLGLGFRSGIFHVEARVQHSSMRYVDEDGIVDLRSTHSSALQSRSDQPPQIFLIEVNPRPPGPDCVYGTSYTYGVDYYGLQLLRVLDDHERFAALSHSFACDAQYITSLLSIPIHRDNLYVPDNYCNEMLRRLSDIALHVSRTECFTPGKTVSPVGGAGFIGYFLINSRESRQNVLEMSEEIKQTSRKFLDSAQDDSAR